MTKSLPTACAAASLALLAACSCSASETELLLHNDSGLTVYSMGAQVDDRENGSQFQAETEVVILPGRTGRLVMNGGTILKAFVGTGLSRLEFDRPRTKAVLLCRDAQGGLVLRSGNGIGKDQASGACRRAQGWSLPAKERVAWPQKALPLETVIATHKARDLLAQGAFGNEDSETLRMAVQAGGAPLRALASTQGKSFAPLSDRTVGNITFYGESGQLRPVLDALRSMQLVPWFAIVDRGPKQQTETTERFSERKPSPDREWEAVLEAIAEQPADEIWRLRVLLLRLPDRVRASKAPIEAPAILVDIGSAANFRLRWIPEAGSVIENVR